MHPSSFVESCDKEIFGFVKAAWKNHSQCSKRQLDICASFIYMMK